MEPIDIAADTAVERSQEHERLRRCLESLAENERAALHAAFFDGNT